VCRKQSTEPGLEEKKKEHREQIGGGGKKTGSKSQNFFVIPGGGGGRGQSERLSALTIKKSKKHGKKQRKVLHGASRQS